MKIKQKILLVHNHYKIPGGEDTVVENERCLLEQNGHEVLLYTRSNCEMDSFPLIKKLLLPFTSLFSFQTYREVRRLIRREGIDLVHVHNTLSLVSPSVYYAAFSCGVPVVQTLHNFRLLCPAAVFMREGKVCEDCVKHGLGCAVRHGCYRGSRAQTLVSAAVLKLHRLLGTYRRLNFICLTEFNKGKLMQLNQRGKTIIREQQIFIKPNFVWVPQLKIEQKKEQYLYVGRLEAVKGIRFLVEAWKELPEKELLICGSGPEEAWVKKYLQENDMKQVKLLGQLPHEEVFRLIAEAKALVMPTRLYEGQPMVILESYAANTPVLASAIGNSEQMIISGKTGYCFAVEDGESLRKAVEKIEHKQNWDIEDIYKKYYTPEKNYETLKQIYDSVSK